MNTSDTGRKVARMVSQGWAVFCRPRDKRRLDDVNKHLETFLNAALLLRRPVTALFWLFLAPLPALAWQTSWDGTLYGYSSRVKLPNGLRQKTATTDLRFDFKAESERLHVFLRPVMLAQNGGHGAYLSQWLLRADASDTCSVAAGREVLNWGPAQFRSPSSPFYFDGGRGNPMLELSGMDMLKFSCGEAGRTLSFYRIVDSGHQRANPWKGSWLLRAQRSEGNWSNGLVLEKTPGLLPFVGAHAQYSASDALLLYVESSSSTLAAQTSAVSAQPVNVTGRSARRTDSLLGGGYTFENGNSVNAEYLHYAHGFSASEESAVPAALPINPPLGRNYLHLVLQSNLMESSYWRLMLTHSFTDSGNEFSGYGEMRAFGNLSLFALWNLPAGFARRTAATSFTAGVKFALP